MKPRTINASARTWLAACEGWTLSQNTYLVLKQDPSDFVLHNKDVASTVPVPQKPLLVSTKPTENRKGVRKLNYATNNKV